MLSRSLKTSFFLLLLSPLSSYAAPEMGTVQIEGQIVPVMQLEIVSQGVSSAKGFQPTLDFGPISASGIIPNPIGKKSRAPQGNEAIYQTDLTVRIRLTGVTGGTRLVVSQVGLGPLNGLVYETDASADFTDVRGLRPVPLEPNQTLVLHNIPVGTHEYTRQIIVRVPATLEPGQKSAQLRYNLLVGQ